MKIAIVDNEKHYRDDLAQLLDRELPRAGFYDVKKYFYSSAEHFLQSYPNIHFDLIFLDIYMDAMDGITLAKKIRQEDPQSVLIFCSTSNDFAFQSYELRAAYYLHKPLTEKKIADMLQNIDISRMNRSQSIRFPNGYQCYLYNILYTTYHNHSVTFHYQDDHMENSWMSQSIAEEYLLSHEVFQKINRGTIVNLQMVSGIARDSGIHMMNGDILPISRSLYQQVLQRYSEYELKKLQLSM